MQRKGELVPMSRERFLAAIKIGVENKIISRSQLMKDNGDWGHVVYQLTTDFIRVWVDYSSTKIAIQEGKEKDVSRYTENRIAPTENRPRDTERRNTLNRITEGNTINSITSKHIESRVVVVEKLNKKENSADSDSAALTENPPPDSGAPPTEESAPKMYASDAQQTLAAKVKMNGQPTAAEVSAVMVEHFSLISGGMDEWNEMMISLNTSEDEVGTIREICLQVCQSAKRYELRDWHGILRPRVMSFVSGRLRKIRQGKIRQGKKYKRGYALKAVSITDSSPTKPAKDEQGNQQFG